MCRSLTGHLFQAVGAAPEDNAWGCSACLMSTRRHLIFQHTQALIADVLPA